MEEKQRYLYLMNNTKTLLNNYSYDELFNKGRVLSYRNRITFDYKLICKITHQEFFETVSVLKNEERFLNKLIESDELSYILNSINDIIRPNHLVTKVLQYLKRNIERIPEDKQEEIKERIVFCISEFQSIRKDDNLYTLKDLLEKTAENENLTIFDIEKITYGGYAKIYRLGDKIIKIGCTRVCESVPDNKRLLIPDFKGHVGNDYVEITDYLDCEDKPSSEEVYGIYKELREQGIRWLDPTELNLARVNKKVLDNINNKRKNINVESIGIIKNDNMKDMELTVGDWVIIDLDHMFWDYENEKMYLAQRDLNEILLMKEDSYDTRYNRENSNKIKFVITKKM